MDIVPFTLLDALDSTRTGDVIDFRKLFGFSRGVLKDFTFYVNVTGAPTAVRLEVQGSINSTNFFTLACHDFSVQDITAGKSMFHVVSKPCMQMKIKVSKLSGGVAPTITMIGIGI